MVTSVLCEFHLVKYLDNIHNNTEEKSAVGILLLCPVPRMGRSGWLGAGRSLDLMDVSPFSLPPALSCKAGKFPKSLFTSFTDTYTGMQMPLGQSIVRIKY